MKSNDWLVTGAWLWISLIPARAGGLPEKYRPTVTTGLRWLVQQQHANGSWSGDGEQYPVALTALAGLALLNEGSTVAEGKYAASLRRATDWLIAKSNRTPKHDGLIADLNQAGEAGRYMFGHGFALHFLSRVYGEVDNREERKKLHDVLTRAVQFTAASQSTSGGWFYTSRLEGHDADEGAVTMPQIHALREARNAGLAVPKEVRDRALAYLKKATTERGGIVYSVGRGDTAAVGGERPALTAAALASLFGRESFADPLCKRWFKYCRTAIPLGDSGPLGNDEYMHFYFAQAVFRLGDDGWKKMFPGDPTEAGLTWDRYRTARFEHLRKTQQPDGGWKSGAFGVGRVYPTAVHLFVMQLDNTEPAAHGPR